MPVLTSNTSHSDLVLSATVNSGDAFYVADDSSSTKWISPVTANFNIQFSRPRKILKIVLEGTIPREWGCHVKPLKAESGESGESGESTVWITLIRDYDATPLSQPNELEIKNPGFYSFYSIAFLKGVTVNKMVLFENQKEIVDVMWPVSSSGSNYSHAAPKLYVDTLVTNNNNKVIKPYVHNFFANAIDNNVKPLIKQSILQAGIKSLIGYIPDFPANSAHGISKYKSMGFDVRTSAEVVTSVDTKWRILKSSSYYNDDAWYTTSVSDFYIEVQLPDAIKIWKFGIAGRPALHSYSIPFNFDQPKGFVLYGVETQPIGTTHGSSLLTAIFSTANANLEQGRIKYFEVKSNKKFSIYRIHVNTTVDGSSCLISNFQLFPVLDMIIN